MYVNNTARAFGRETTTAIYGAMEEYVAERLCQGTIHHTSSPGVAGLFFVKKKKIEDSTHASIIRGWTK